MRTYTFSVSDFDDGSQVEGFAWSPSVSTGRWVAVGLAGDGSLLGNVGLNVASISGDGITWSFSGGLQLPFAPAEIADVIWSNLNAYYCAGYSSPATAFGEWLSNLGVNWSRISRGTTATFECSICNITSGPRNGTLVVGGQLNSGTGRLIGRTIAGVFNTVSTPIDNQFFRVTQIAYESVGQALIATLSPVGIVTVPERVMRSLDGGITWTLCSTPLDNLAAYGVCRAVIPGPSTVMFVTGQTKTITTNDGGTTWVDLGTIPAGVHGAGKPAADSNGVVYIPGGDTNAITEATPAAGPVWSFASTTLSGLVTAKVCGYSPDINQVLVGGLGGPTKAIWRGAPAVAAVVPSLDARFDL